MKTIFTGIGKNGEYALKELIKSKRRVNKVIVPQGYNTSMIEELARKNKISCKKTKGRRQLESEIIRSNGDLLIVASCPYLFSKKTLGSLKTGAINIHGSYLPHYRGYHPIHWAIINGEAYTGVTVHYIDEDIDKGDIISQKKLPITFNDDINTMIEKVSKEGAKLLVKILPLVEKGKEKRVRQGNTKSIRAPKRSPEDGKINWKKSSSTSIFNLSRALQSPYPYPYTFLRKEKVEIISTYKPKKPGRIIGKIDKYFLIETVDGIVAARLTDSSGVKIGDVLI